MSQFIKLDLLNIICLHMEKSFQNLIKINLLE